MNNNGSPQGIGVGVGDINVLKDTDLGVLRTKNNYDKSTYTKTTKADGTVVEKVKMNKKGTNTGVLDFQTQGVGIGNKSGKTAEVFVSENSTEDAVGFVDSIWGSRQAAGQIQQRRMMEAQNKAGSPRQTEQEKLLQFKNARQAQLSEDHMVRELAAQQQMNLPGIDQTVGRAI